MAIERLYKLEVIAKYEGTHGYGNIMLKAPSVNGQELEIHRPWWFDKTYQGAPVTVDLSPEEMKVINVGDLFEVILTKCQ